MKSVVTVLSLLFLLPIVVLSQHRCFTPELLSSNTAQSFLKKSGKRFTQFISVADTAQQRTFFARSIFTQSHWDTITASRIFSSSEAVLWLDTTLESNFFTTEERDSLISSFKRNLLEETSSYSINPSKGILNIEHEYFGLPPNVDGDSVLDILLFDIKDGYPSSGSYIAGFFDPNDLVDFPFSNKRDLLYIDVYPLIKEGKGFSPDAAMSTIAHEYQHLIHAHYEENESEYVFINEGLSEFAETFCGFTPRSGNRYAQNPNRSLLSWNYSDPIPDYSRASLWTEYLFEQIGYQCIKSFVQSPKVGMEAINELLSLSTNLSFLQIFTNWTLANFINDSSYSLVYAYKHPLRKSFHLQPQFSNDTLPSANSIIIPSSSCYVVQYPFVEQLTLESNNLNPFLTFSASTFQPNGAKSVLPSLASNSLHVTTIPNSNTTVQLLIRNVQAIENETDISGISLSYLASGKKSGRTMQFVYDNGVADAFNSNARYLLIDSSSAVGVSFVHQREGWLKEISVKCIFLSEVQGSGVPQGTQRDIQVQIYSFKNGFPDSAITSKKLVLFQRQEGVLSFESIPLDEFYTQLSALKDTFCVVLSNDYDDNNYFAIGLDNSTDTHSFLYENDTLTQSFRWNSFRAKAVEDTSLAHWNAMVRCNSVFQLQPQSNNSITVDLNFSATQSILTLSHPFQIDSALSRCIVKTPQEKYFILNVKNESPNQIQFPYDGEGDYRIALSLFPKEEFTVFDTTLTYNFTPVQQFEVGNNYPNPFNNSTTIPITAYVNCNITMQLYNILGQLVYSKNLGFTQPGNYAVPLNLSQFSSSIYFLKISFTEAKDPKNYIAFKKIVFIK